MQDDGDNQTNNMLPAPRTDAVPSSVFDARKLPLKQALAIWHEAMGTSHDIRLHDAPEQRLRTRMQAWHLGEAFFGTLETVSQEFRRSRYHVGLGGGDCVSVNFIKEGMFYCPELNLRARPGDMIIRDKAEPLTFHARALVLGATYHTLGFIIPRRLVDALLASPNRSVAMVHDGRLPLVALLRRYLYALERELPGMTRLQAQAIIRPTVDLLATAMNGAPLETTEYTLNNALVQQVQHHIDAHVKDPTLSAATIAANFRISVRKLYQLFEPMGGVHSTIQKKRLEHIHAELVDPAQSHRRVQDIAESYGFTQRKTFNMAFRRLYGITPREVRGYAAEGRSRNLAHIYAEQNLWNWMLELH